MPFIISMAKSFSGDILDDEEEYLDDVLPQHLVTEISEDFPEGPEHFASVVLSNKSLMLTGRNSHLCKGNSHGFFKAGLKDYFLVSLYGHCPVDLLHHLLCLTCKPSRVETTFLLCIQIASGTMEPWSLIETPKHYGNTSSS